MKRTAFWRLLWKEYRMQRAFWLAMVVLTFLLQVLMVWLSEDLRGPEERSIFAFAVFFAALYAAGSGATLFATERETGTYEFQRIVPVSWLRLFAAKAAWAGLSTLAMLGVLSLLAAWILRWQLPDAASAAEIWALLGFAAVELLLWGMLFSLLVDQPLVAAILAITTVSLYVHLLAFNLGTWHEMSGYLKALPLRAVIAAIVGAVDLWLARRWFRGGGRVLSVSARVSRAEGPGGGGATLEPERPSRWLLVGHLLWQQWRQSRRMMLVLAAMAAVFVYVGLWTVRFGGRGDEQKVSFLLELASLAAAFCGCCVFLGDQRREQLGFLADRGARPGFVWLTRQLVWLPAWLAVLGAGLLAFLLFPVNEYHYWIARFDTDRLAAASQLGIGVVSRPRLIDLAVCVSVAYASGQFCSMLFRGGILTLVFGGILAFGLCLWTQLMRALDLSPLWSAAPLAAAMLAATWLRTPNWILRRNTVRAWLPVATVVVVPAIAILVAVPLVRVHGLPEAVVLRSVPGFMQVYPIGIELRNKLTLRNELTPEERATAEMYRRATDLVRPMKSFIPPDELAKLAEPEPPKAPQPESPPVVTPRMVAFVKGNQEALAATLAATRRPLGDVTHPPKPEHRPRQTASYFDLWHLLVTSAQVAQSQGNLDEAMDRYLAALRLRRYEAFHARAWVIDQSELTIYNDLPYWAALPGQTPQRLRAMLREIDALVRTFPPLDLTVKQQRARVLDLLAGDPQAIAAVNLHESIVYKIALYCRWFPWEITRARRILEQETYRDWLFCGELENHAASGRAIPVGRLEDYDTARDLRYWRGRPLGLELYLGSYYPQERLNFDFSLRFRELEARRRVIRLTLALFAWRLEHGRLPDSLDALVGPDLPRLPVDPYSGQPFKYFPAGFAFPIVGSSEMHSQWKVFSSGTPMLASAPLSLVFGAAGAFITIDERWWAPNWPDWPAAKTSWFARRIYPLPQPQKSAAAATNDVPKGTSDVPEGRLTIAQRFIAGDAEPRKTVRPVGTVETGGTQ